MRKREELTDPASCLSKALDGEMAFVLLARDKAAPVAIRAWIGERLRLGKNHPGDAQITEAEQCARIMEVESLGYGSVAIVCPACGSGDTFRSVLRDPPDSYRCFKCGNAWRDGVD